MKSTAKLITALALTGFATLAMAKSQDLGVLPTGGVSFGNSFTSQTSFTDTYQFVIGGTSVTGTESDTSWSFATRDVNVSSISLRQFGTSIIPSGWTDVDTNEFTFSGLMAGVKYELVVAGTAGSQLPGVGGKYAGTIMPVAASVASAAPEPAEMLLLAMGLGGVGVWVRRQKRA
jgi:hypothetical protein